MPAQFWYADLSSPKRVASVASAEHADGVRVELTSLPADVAAIATLGADEEVQRVEVQPRFAPGTPPLWYLESRESAGHPPAVNVMAFTGHGVLAGELLDLTGFSNIDAQGADQLGAVRWYPASGEVDQIYVQPAWRRRGIGSALLYAAGVLSVARNWPRLWGDGQRTALGEDFRNAGEWRDRAADLTNVAPPMTPPG